MVELTMHQVDTTGQGDVRDLTPIVARALQASSLESGLATVAVIGSTAGVTSASSVCIRGSITRADRTR